MRSRIALMFALLLVGAGCVRAEERATVAIPYVGSARVDVARTAEDRGRGLSYRDDIGDGMLFCFDDSAPQFFWMFEMRASLDAVWINDGYVTSVQRDIPVRDEAGEWTRFVSGSPANALIELPAGTLGDAVLSAGTPIPDVKRACS